MTKEKKILLKKLLKQYKQSLNQNNYPIAFQYLTHMLGKGFITFVEQYGNLWKSKNNIVFVTPIRKNSGFIEYMKKLNFITDAQEAGNNIYKIIINKNKLNDFIKKSKN